MNDENSLALGIILSRLAGRTLLRLHDQFGRAQGLAEHDLPFIHDDLLYTLERLDAVLRDDRIGEQDRRVALAVEIEPLLDLATAPGSYPDLDIALVNAVVDALSESPRYTPERIALISG